MSRADRGDAAERYVAGRLERSGYQILDTNWRTRYGEIDIVALQGEILVFVEVRARTGQRMGYADETVDTRKLERITQTALAYIEERPDYAEHYWRVDLVALTLDRTGAVQRVGHYENLTLD